MAKVRRMTKKRLGELLVDEGLITDAQVGDALAEQKKTKELLGEVLVRKSYVTERDIARTLATQFSLPFISARKYDVSKEVAELIPDEMLERHQFVPIDRFADVLTIVVSGVVDNRALDEIEALSGCTVKVCVGTATDVKEVRNLFKGKAKEQEKNKAAMAAPPPAAGDDDEEAKEKAPIEIEVPKEEEVAELLAAMGGGAPAAELVEEPLEEEPEPVEEEQPPKPASKKAPAPAKAKSAGEAPAEQKSSKPAWTRKVTRKVRKKT